VSVPVKLAGFAAVLAAAFGAATLAGAAIGPERAGGVDAPAARGEGAGGHGSGAPAAHGEGAGGHGSGAPAAHGEGAGGHGSGAPAAHGEGAGGHGSSPAGHAAPDPVRGLAVAEDGLRVVVDDPELRRGARSTLRLRVVDERGETVRDFDAEHERRMHLIVARRDLATFQHLHPEQQADGSWAVPLRLDEAGSYRLFADFSRGGGARTLATDLRVDGEADLRPLPARARRP